MSLFICIILLFVSAVDVLTAQGFDERIVNGTNASPGELPYMVNLLNVSFLDLKFCFVGFCKI